MPEASWVVDFDTVVCSWYTVDGIGEVLDSRVGQELNIARCDLVGGPQYMQYCFLGISTLTVRLANGFWAPWSKAIPVK